MGDGNARKGKLLKDNPRTNANHFTLHIVIEFVPLIA